MNQNSDHKIRVIHLNTARTWRGGERQVFLLAKTCAEEFRGQQMVVCPPGSVLEKECADNGIPCMPLSMAGELDFFAAWKLRKMALLFKANIIHAHTAKAHGIALLVKMFLPGIKVVVSRRVDFHISKNFLSRYKYMTSRVDRFIAISKNVKKILLEDGIDESRIDIAYSGLDLERFKKRPRKTGLLNEFAIKPGTLIVGNIAALVDHKDQKTLIEAVRRLRERKKNLLFRVFIVGEGELRSELESLSEKYGLLADGTVTFTGFRTDVDAFLSLFDVFVMSSKEEGLGTSVLDAMAAGLPVCATSGGGIPEMIDDGPGGYLTPVGDAAALSHSMEKLLTSGDLRKKMSSYNKKRVKNFSRQSTYRQNLSVYRKVLKNEI